MVGNELKTVPNCFYNTCKNFPQRTAQRFNKDLYPGETVDEISYGEMLKRVEAIAGGLMELGFEKQEKVALMSKSSPYWTHTDMAVSISGGVTVTIYPTLSINEVTYIVNDSSSSYFFVGSEEVLETIKPGLDKMPSIKKVIVMDLMFKGDGDKFIGITELMDLGNKWLEKSSTLLEERWQSVDLDDMYTILYTSGTTGMGKGVILTHWCSATRLKGSEEFFAKHNMSITEEDVTLCFLPLSHIFDRGSCQLLALFYGACICYADSPGTLLADMQKYNPTWFNCVPRLYEKIYITFNQEMAKSKAKKLIFDWALSVGRKAVKYRMNDDGSYNMHQDFDLKSKLPFFLKLKFGIADKLFAKVRALFGNRYRFSFSASAGIAEDLLEFYYTLGLAVLEGYGSTESFNACALNVASACKPGFVGVEALGSFLRVADDGELEISGAGIFKGYLNKPEENEESFTEDGWFKTGDLVIMDEKGYYKIVDRKKAIICTAVGKNIAPAKIENLFSTSSVIEQIFLIGDERNFISALVVPNFNYFVDAFDSNSISYNKDDLVWSEASGVPICTKVGDDFVGQSLLKELIDKDVEAANKELERFEQIKQYTVIKSRFTEENGELTPTQKTKKRIILEHYDEVIEKMYSSN